MLGINHTAETLKNPSLDFCILGSVNGTSLYHYSGTGSEKRGFHFPPFSVPYSDRKRQHIPVLQETLINQSLPKNSILHSVLRRKLFSRLSAWGATVEFAERY